MLRRPGSGRRLLARVSADASTVADDLGPTGRRIAIGLAACIAFFTIAGAAHEIAAPIQAFDLEGEVHLGASLWDALILPALFSGGLLFVAGGLAFAAGRRSGRPLPWFGLTVLFIFMGADELAMIHERLGRLAGVEWQIVYLPIALGAGVLWFSTLKLMRTSSSDRLLWIGAAACWVFAQPWEPMTGPIGYVGAGLEEVLEMCGSAMFLLALYLMAQAPSGEQARLGSHHPGSENAV